LFQEFSLIFSLIFPDKSIFEIASQRVWSKTGLENHLRITPTYKYVEHLAFLLQDLSVTPKNVTTNGSFPYTSKNPWYITFVTYNNLKRISSNSGCATVILNEFLKNFPAISLTVHPSKDEKVKRTTFKLNFQDGKCIEGVGVSSKIKNAENLAAMELVKELVKENLLK
jgi:hypothetical protein